MRVSEGVREFEQFFLQAGNGTLLGATDLDPHIARFNNDLLITGSVVNSALTGVGNTREKVMVDVCCLVDGPAVSHGVPGSPIGIPAIKVVMAVLYCVVILASMLSFTGVSACSCMLEHPQQYSCSADFVALSRLKTNQRGTLYGCFSDPTLTQTIDLATSIFD
uniref:Uncharacterized protein n=1 Tax=Timema bartmani TaxID=61472 RepID=A0A7R9F2W0_9NEOP|nr:unnamed protein product [Timema bartmani]